MDEQKLKLVINNAFLGAIEKNVRAMLKSPLRYPCGKSRAVETIAKLIPDFDEFREPFLGGGSVFVYVKLQFQLTTAKLYEPKMSWHSE